MNTEFSKKLGLEIPLIVAPMGGYTTADLVISSCEGGALGSMAAAYMNPNDIVPEAQKIRAKTKRPFSVNLFTPMPKPKITAEQIRKSVLATRQFREELGIPDPVVQAPFHPDFDEQFAAVMEVKPAVFSFVFGLLDSTYLDECRKRGILTMGTATTLAEAVQLENSGVDSVLIQGTEAGGHRGIFSTEAEEPGISTLSLLKEVVAKLKIPVIAAGGLVHGSDISLVLQHGAQAAQMGTAFLLCPEISTKAAHRRALRATLGPTQLTRAFSGRLARGISNRFMKYMETKSEEILPFPAQNAFTRDLRDASAKKDIPDMMSLWAGIGYSEIRDQVPARELIEDLKSEMIRSVK